MKSKAEVAAELFIGGSNCAQAVFGAFCEDYGLKASVAFSIACGLGSGARNAELCGAVSGAVLVIGLKYGCDTAVCNAKVEEFTERFRELNGHIVCRALLGCDIATAAGREDAVSRSLFTTRCLELTKGASEILAELGYINS